MIPCSGFREVESMEADARAPKKGHITVHHIIQRVELSCVTVQHVAYDMLDTTKSVDV